MPERRMCEGGCNRWLTDPVSIARGFGKRCAELHGIPVDSPPRLRRPPRPAARPADAPVEIHPDQTALPLQPMQPSLWSL
ncbi:DUF6011 domain-containing protein [Streptomyces violaceus]